MAQLKYRTHEGIWGSIDYPVIGIEQNENNHMFTAYGYNSESEVDFTAARCAISDLVEYELYENQN